MKGKIKRIIPTAFGNNEFGFIVGEDGNDYYFDNRSISNGLTTQDFDKGDTVEFDIIIQPNRDQNMATKMSLAEVVAEPTITTTEKMTTKTRKVCAVFWCCWAGRWY